MTELEKRIQELANAYYQGKEIVSDTEYDCLMERLKREQPNSTLIKGAQEQLKGIKKKYKLPHTMGTLEKCMDEESFKEFWEQYCKNEIVVENKIDGNSALLEYKDGKFIFAYSRGDTEYGEDLTKSLNQINFPKEIEGLNGYIRGEVYLKRSIFDKYYSNQKNPRNTAAGLLNKKSVEECSRLSFIAYDLWNEKNDDTEAGKIAFLEKAGFEIPEYHFNPTYEEVLQLRNNLITDGEIPCDGLVIKQNKVNKEDLERKTPMYNFAFKPSPSIRTTIVKDIIWQLQGSNFAPVAIVEPVELCGTIVKRTSLSNINIMNQLGVYIGAEVAIKKSGMIIPDIVEVLSEKKKNNFIIPQKCPICKEKIIVSESGIPYCNNKNCKQKTRHRFLKMFDILKIKGAGVSFVNSLVDNNITVIGFLKLVKNNSNLNKYAGGINGEKILKQMKEKLSTPISTATFLALFDFEGFDEKKLKPIKSLDISAVELLRLDGFAEKTAYQLLKSIEENKEEIEEMLEFFNIEEKSLNGKLAGKSFCFTGTCCKPRKELQDLVETNGGENKSGVTKNLNYLVTDDKDTNSSKGKKARELGIQIISSEEFLKML